MSQHKKKQRMPFPKVHVSVAHSPASAGGANTRAHLPVTPGKPPEDPEATQEEIRVVKSPDPLVDEVQTFLRQRQELAQRLAEEIAATERKLVELKQTAALLAPASQSSSTGTKGRPGKKSTRAGIRMEKPAAAEPTSKPAADS